jgi:hypothetical protein
MRRLIAAAGLAAGLGLSFVPAASASVIACETYSPKGVCIPSACFTAANVVSLVNDAAGEPLGPGTFPHCID